MSMIAVGVGPALVGLALLWTARQTGARGESSGLVLVLAPPAFLSITIPLFLGALEFVNGFQRLAQAQGGGVQVVAPLCLGIARPLFLGTIATLASMVAAAAFQAFFRRDRAPDFVEVQKPSSRFIRALLVAGSGLAVPVAGLLYTAQKLASLTMLVVDPMRREQAQVALAGLGLAQVSGMIATRSMLVLYGSAALSAVLLGFGIAGLLAVRSSKHGRLLRGYSWLFLLAVTVTGAWGIIQLRADVSWYEAAMGGGS